MPGYGKKRQRSGSRLSWSAYKLGQLVDKAGAVQRENENWGRAKAILDNPGETFNELTASQGMRGMAGRGAYWGKSMGGIAGKALGGRFGLAAAGGSIGSKLGDWASDRLEGMFSGRGLYSGSGDYTHQNALVSGVNQDTVHMAQAASYGGFGDEQGAIIIRNKEYIQDVYAPGVIGSGVSIPFSNISYALNPGLQGTFTFLSQIAQNYDEYEFQQLLFTYRSTTTDIGTTSTGQCGTIILCTNYNAASPKFTDKQSMVEYSGAHSCKLTEHMVHGVECDPNKSAMSPSLFVRANPVVTGQDLKTYDKGLFQFGIANCPSAFNGLPIGELWCEYTVVLRKPKLFVSRGLEIDSDFFQCPLPYDAATAVNGSNFQNPLGTSFSTQVTNCRGQQNNIGCAVYSAGENVSLFTTSPLTINGLAPTDAQWIEGLNSFAAITTIPAGSIAIVFPAAYVGNISVTLLQSGRGPTGVIQNSMFLASNIGNITAIRDLYTPGIATGLNPSYLACGVNTFAAGSNVGTSSRWDIFVSAASGGVNNVFFIGSNMGPGDAGDPTVAELLICQYQANGVTQNTQRVQWVSVNNGVLQIPLGTV